MIHSHHQEILDWIDKMEAESVINKIFRPLIKEAFKITKPYKGEGRKLTETELKQILINHCVNKQNILIVDKQKIIQEIINLVNEEAFIKTLEGYKIFIKY